MFKIIMLIWALATLWGNIKAYKTNYFSDRNELNKKALEAIEKADRDGAKGFLIGGITIGILVNVTFWIIATLAFTNPLFILYGCIFIALCIFMLFKTIEAINTKTIPNDGIISYIVTPLNTVFIISYIVILLF